MLPSTSCTSSGDMSTMQAMASALTSCMLQQDVRQHERSAMPMRWNVRSGWHHKKAMQFPRQTTASNTAQKLMVSVPSVACAE